jgi:rhamnulokinase
MGLWMIQSVKKELDDAFSFAELCGAAERESITSVIDCNYDRFLAPESMINEIKQACAESGQIIPDSPGELAAVVYNSLAACYRGTVLELERLMGRKYNAIHIVGGGSNAEYLNRLTARYTGKDVFAGPAEATAIGNLTAQMITGGEFKNLKEGRECIKNSVLSNLT